MGTPPAEFTNSITSLSISAKTRLRVLRDNLGEDGLVGGAGRCAQAPDNDHDTKADDKDTESGENSNGM